MWPAIGSAELLVTEVRGQRQAVMPDDAVEMGMKTTDTQTELIDGSPSSEQDIDFKIVDEQQQQSSGNKTERHLNINCEKDINGLRSIDDDASSGRRILFTPDSHSEANL